MKRIVIIGGGIAGLSAGIFAQKNGFESIILEKHAILGGECTGWDRDGFHIDGCIHWLVGTKTGTPMNDLWKAVGALEDVDIYHPDTFLSFEHKEATINIYRDIEKMKTSWTTISPEDKEVIEEFCQDLKKLDTFEVDAEKPMDLMTLKEKMKKMMSMKDAGMIMKKYGKITLNEFGNRFKHPALKEMFSTFLPEHYSAAFLFFGLATFTKDESSIPIGGSKAMALRMAEKYQALGGKALTNREVIGVEINKKHVKKMVCKNGETFTGDYYIAACDAHFLFQNLLKGKHTDKKYKTRFHNSQDYPLASNMYIGIGYEGEMGDQQRSVKFPIKPFTINQTPIEHLLVNHYGYEPSFAPKGHTVLTCAINQFGDDYEYWKNLKKDPKSYKSEKERVGQAVIERLTQKFPEMTGKLKLLDVASPATYERYCNAYRGAFMGFLPTLKGKMMAHTGKIKGLKNLMLSGQWLQPPGGLPNAAITGKDSIMRICKMEKRTFKT